MKQLFSVAGKTILVTGGTRGIGLAITRALAKSGATVIANYARDQKSAGIIHIQRHHDFDLF